MFDILGTLRGAITGSVDLSRWIKKKWRRRHFNRVFGEDADEYYLAFGILVVRPDLLTIVPPKNRNLADFPLAKPSRLGMAFSAQKVASGCEIRAVAYVVSALMREGGILSNVVTDEFLSDRLDVDFISFGALSDLKTLDVFGNSANDLADYDPTQGYFVSKKNRRPLYERRIDCDYGIVLKIHPSQFPNRTWICCAGWGEWGTSGSSYFLARKWREIARQVEQGDRFVCVIEVDRLQDESARLLAICKTPEETVAISKD
jgi:hypothetical protein